MGTIQDFWMLLKRCAKFSPACLDQSSGRKQDPIFSRNDFSVVGMNRDYISLLLTFMKNFYLRILIQDNYFVLVIYEV